MDLLPPRTRNRLALDLDRVLVTVLLLSGVDWVILVVVCLVLGSWVAEGAVGLWRLLLLDLVLVLVGGASLCWLLVTCCCLVVEVVAAVGLVRLACGSLVLALNLDLDRVL